ncbi:MAG: NUDIX domain-containing protein [Candidatus Daviesbacteria bacterium]|nr:NUDIX domain-containing protein [Candidatus Daviesbacteria bacterium]
MRKEDEQVLVIARKIVLPKPWTGINNNGIEGFEDLIRASGIFKRRGDIEDDPNWQQITPYMVFRHENKYFLMQRSSDGGEKQLYNMYSIGIGGHLRKKDLEGKTILDWAKREFEEEVDFKGSYISKVLGLLNDDRNLVGQVHLGYVFLLEGNSDQISIKDEHQSGKLATMEEIKRIYPQMETWSQLVYDFLKGKNG